MRIVLLSEPHRQENQPAHMELRSAAEGEN